MNQYYLLLLHLFNTSAICYSALSQNLYYFFSFSGGFVCRSHTSGLMYITFLVIIYRRKISNEIHSLGKTVLYPSDNAVYLDETQVKRFVCYSGQ